MLNGTDHQLKAVALAVQVFENRGLLTSDFKRIFL